MADNNEQRNTLRSQLLKKRDAQRKTVIFNGVEIELVQPKVSWVISRPLDKPANIVDFLISFARIPGTDTPVFEEGDRGVLTDMPFDAETKKAVDVINTLMGVDVDEAVKNSQATPSANT